MSTKNKSELTESLKESFMAMGYTEREAEIAAKGPNWREYLFEADDNFPGSNDIGGPKEPPPSSPLPPPDVKVSGTYQAKDSPNVNRSFDDLLTYLNFQKPTLNMWVRDYKSFFSRQQAVDIMSINLDAMGFTKAAATKAAETIFGSSGELPAQVDRDKAANASGNVGVSKGKESKRFLLLDQDGKGIAICEAADKTDAELYGWRKLIDQGFMGNIRELSEGENIEADVAQAFKELGQAYNEPGMSEKQTREWMNLRKISESDRGSSLPVIQVPYQAPDPRFMKPGQAHSHFPMQEVQLREKGKN